MVVRVGLWPLGRDRAKLNGCRPTMSERELSPVECFGAARDQVKTGSETSIAERIDAVWELTRQCLEWTRTGTDGPRLQRSASRVQRSRS